MKNELIDKPINVIQRIPLGVDPQIISFQATFNPADILSSYQSRDTEVFLKSIEVVDLLFYTIHLDPSDPLQYDASFAWKGLNPCNGYDVAGVYQPILKRIGLELPTACFYNKRYNGTSPRLAVDLLHGKVDFGYNIDLNGLLNYLSYVKIDIYESAIMSQLGWHTAATVSGSSTQAYVTLQYVIEILSKY